VSHERTTYLRAVLAAYVALPDTPERPRHPDRTVAARLYDRRVPLATVTDALTLASARRTFRAPEAPALPPIRSLAYFLPVIDELLAHPLPNGYIEYLTAKLRRAGRANRPENRVSS
jgi:hypothetical protein